MGGNGRSELPEICERCQMIHHRSTDDVIRRKCSKNICYYESSWDETDSEVASDDGWLRSCKRNRKGFTDCHKSNDITNKRSKPERKRRLKSKRNRLLDKRLQESECNNNHDFINSEDERDSPTWVNHENSRLTNVPDISMDIPCNQLDCTPAVAVPETHPNHSAEMDYCGSLDILCQAAEAESNIMLNNAIESEVGPNVPIDRLAYIDSQQNSCDSAVDSYLMPHAEVHDNNSTMGSSKQLAIEYPIIDLCDSDSDDQSLKSLVCVMDNKLANLTLPDLNEIIQKQSANMHSKMPLNECLMDLYRGSIEMVQKLAFLDCLLITGATERKCLSSTCVPAALFKNFTLKESEIIYLEIFNKNNGYCMWAVEMMRELCRRKFDLEKYVQKLKSSLVAERGCMSPCPIQKAFALASALAIILPRLVDLWHSQKTPSTTFSNALINILAEYIDIRCRAVKDILAKQVDRLDEYVMANVFIIDQMLKKCFGHDNPRIVEVFLESSVSSNPTYRFICWPIFWFYSSIITCQKENDYFRGVTFFSLMMKCGIDSKEAADYAKKQLWQEVPIACQDVIRNHNLRFSLGFTTYEFLISNHWERLLGVYFHHYAHNIKRIE